MATTNDDSVINLGRLKTFKNKLDSESMGMHVVEVVTNSGTQTADATLIKKYWPNVMLKRDNAFYYPQTSFSPKDEYPSYLFSSVMHSLLGNVVTSQKVTTLQVRETTNLVKEYDSLSSAPNIATNPTLLIPSTTAAAANGSKTLAAGDGSKAQGLRSTAIGGDSAIANTLSVAIGSLTVSDAGAVAVGCSAQAGSSSVAIGKSADIKGSNSVAIGYGAFSKEDLVENICIGKSASSAANSAVVIGAMATANNNAMGSVVLGQGSKAYDPMVVAVGNVASGTTRRITDVTDPTSDQDAATRYWVKNADRSDVFSTNHVSSAAGGTGELYLEANADLNWVSLRGYIYWSSFSDAWANMVRIPGEDHGGWWIKADLKVPDKMKPKSNFIAHCAGLDFLGEKSIPYYPDDFAVGTDGYIYFSKWSTSHNSTPLGVAFFGHRFYM